MEGRLTDMGGREKPGGGAGHALTTTGRRKSANIEAAPMIGISLRGSFSSGDCADICSAAALVL